MIGWSFFVCHWSTVVLQEPSLHAAVMLEQAAGCYLLSKPPLLRKYGFHLILAGNRYYISDQVSNFSCIVLLVIYIVMNDRQTCHRFAHPEHSLCDVQIKHAIRAYRNALFVYNENAWSYINDHVHFNVGRYPISFKFVFIVSLVFLSVLFHFLALFRWYGFLGMFDVAINHMLEVLACGHQSLATQSTFLSDFFHFVQVVYE